MALPHPKAGEDNYGDRDKPDNRCIVRQLFERTINVTGYRNGHHEMYPAKNRTLSTSTYHMNSFSFSNKQTYLNLLTRISQSDRQNRGQIDRFSRFLLAGFCLTRFNSQV